MKRIDYDNGTYQYQLESAGLRTGEEMLFHPGVSSCGQIKDGVSFCFSKSGSWVVPFAELEAMYLAAKEQRGITSPVTGSVALDCRTCGLKGTLLRGAAPATEGRARIAALEKALRDIRDSTYRNAVTLRGMADAALGDTTPATNCSHEWRPNGVGGMSGDPRTHYFRRCAKCGEQAWSYDKAPAQKRDARYSCETDSRGCMSPTDCEIAGKCIDAADTTPAQGVAPQSEAGS